MRHVRLPVAIVAAVCALAIAAAPAMAEGFTSTGGPTKGAALGTQTIKVGTAKSITIKCEKAKSTGTTAAGSLTAIVDVVSPKKCSYLGKGVHFLTPFEIEYKNPLLIEEENDVKILNNVEFTVAAIKCKVTIDEQALPKEEHARAAAAEYAEKITPGKGKKPPTTSLDIKNKFKELEWETEAIREEHGLCAELEEPSGENGTYTGEISDEIKGGNLAL